MTPRAVQIAAFLEDAGWGLAERVTLAGDASNRRYERLCITDSGARAVLMDAPPEKGEDTRPFIQIANHLSGHGFSAPAIVASDENAGLLLLEDLGDALYARVIADGQAHETELYSAAVDVLAALHRYPPPRGLPAYHPALMAEKAALAGQWYAGGTAEIAATDPDHPASLAISGAIAPLLVDHASDATVLVQRDYHAENLLWLPDRDGVSRVGLLDFQDALAGHPAYDLVSLLEDARRDVPDHLQAAMRDRYIASISGSPEAFKLAYALLGAQRNLRILGVFARLSLHFGKPHYTELIPRVWGHLQRDLAHPALIDLKRTVDRVLPVPDTEQLNRLKSRCATVQMP